MTKYWFKGNRLCLFRSIGWIKILNFILNYFKNAKRSKAKKSEAIESTETIEYSSLKWGMQKKECDEEDCKYPNKMSRRQARNSINSGRQHVATRGSVQKNSYSSPTIERVQTLTGY